MSKLKTYQKVFQGQYSNSNRTNWWYEEKIARTDQLFSACCILLQDARQMMKVWLLKSMGILWQQYFLLSSTTASRIIGRTCIYGPNENGPIIKPETLTAWKYKMKWVLLPSRQPFLNNSADSVQNLTTWYKLVIKGGWKWLEKFWADCKQQSLLRNFWNDLEVRKWILKSAHSLGSVQELMDLNVISCPNSPFLLACARHLKPCVLLCTRFRSYNV